MRRRVWGFTAGLIAFASTAFAAQVGDTLYIRAKNTKVLKRPKPTARVIAVLQPGTEVVWDGATRKKGWHKVIVGKKKGVVYRSTLSSKKPKVEMTQSGESVDTQAFASSGAATKALGSGAKTYGENNNMAEAVAALETLEAMAKKVTPKQIARHVKKNKLAPNVGGKKR